MEHLCDFEHSGTHTRMQGRQSFSCIGNMLLLLNFFVLKSLDRSKLVLATAIWEDGIFLDLLSAISPVVVAMPNNNILSLAQCQGERPELTMYYHGGAIRRQSKGIITSTQATVC